MEPSHVRGKAPRVDRAGPGESPTFRHFVGERALGGELVCIDSAPSSPHDVPMKAFSVKELQANFSRLMRRVTAGEEVIIKRAGTPVARLAPVEPLTLRVLGIDGGVFTVPDGFNDPVTEDGSDPFGL